MVHVSCGIGEKNVAWIFVHLGRFCGEYVERKKIASKRLICDRVSLKLKAQSAVGLT